jgi:hypothetical protein
MTVYAERFWSKVDVGNQDECWEWSGCRVRGYGQFHIGNRKRVRAHRFAYELLVGEIPEGLVLDHLCRNTACCNPAHLEAVTTRENILRGVGLAAANSRKTHCKNGHEFTPENTYSSPSEEQRGWRECRVCRAASWARAA